MTPDEIDALVARAEGASGPSRDLDKKLALTIGGWKSDFTDSRQARNPHGAGTYWKRDDFSWTREDESDYPTAYTASIDAALDLVERVLPGWDVQMIHEAGSGWECQLDLYEHGIPIASIVGAKKTAPLAIILALLRALKSESKP